MRRILLIWFFIPSLLLTQHIWFSDDFSKGLSGKNWNVSSGNWELKDGVLSIETKEYDQLICAPLLIYNVHDFTIEVELNGNRAGIFFSLDNRNNKNLSQMVRFDEQSLLTGFFNSNGEYNATNVFDVKKSPTDWSSLKIDVRPSERIFNISINGEFIGSDTLLKFVSGYIGLQASEGISLFKSVKVTSKFPYIRQPIPSLGTKLNTQHLDWIRSKGSQIELFTPLYNKIVTINKDNTVFDVQNCKIPVVKRKYIKNGKLQISIDGNGILLNDKFRKYSKKITEQLVRPAEILQGKENSFLVVDPGALAIFQFDFEGRLVKKYTAATIGGFKSCNSFDWYGKNEIVVADYDRIIFIPSSLDEIQTQIKQTSKNETTISWTSEIESVPEVIIKAKGEKEISIKGTRTKTLNSVKLFNLKSATKYSFTISPTIRVLPEKDCMSKTFHFVSGPTALNKTLISRLPVLIMVYRTISYRDIYTKLQYPNIPSGRTLSNDEIEDLKNCASFNSEFFFRNSHCKMVLDFDFFVIEDTLWLKEVGMKDPYWLGPNERVTKDYEKTCSIFNKSPESYAGLIVPYAWLNFPPRRRSAMSDASKTDTVNIRQAVGGGTYGVPAPWKYGKTTGYTSNPFQDRFSRQDWLITHEFHHQIDALMASFGYDEYFHADQPWKMPGVFGEDFDFNAKIVRKASPEKWLLLPNARIMEVFDYDGDGVPDDENSLPFDEKRLQGSPLKIDTDGDGISDLQEVMAGTSKGSILNIADSDGDSIIDGQDTEPLYPVNTIIKKILVLNSIPFFTHYDGKDCRVNMYLGWTDTSLLIKTITPSLYNILFQIDANADGWFHGFDNFQLRIVKDADSLKIADFYLRDCSSWVEPPKDRRDILTKEGVNVQAVYDSIRKEYTSIINILKNPNYGLEFYKGKEIVIRIGFQTHTDLWVWDEVFERNYMLKVKLQEYKE